MSVMLTEHSYKMVITYVCGRKWHVKDAFDVFVSDAKGGGKNLQYTTNTMVKHRDRLETSENIYEITSGDVARVEFHEPDHGYGKMTTTYNFQVIKGE